MHVAIVITHQHTITKTNFKRLNCYEFSSAGKAGEELARQAHQWWQEAAVKAGADLVDLDLAASLDKRIAWALSKGNEIATVYAHGSTKCQQSAADQIRECVTFAAANRMYVPPELVSIDESVHGHRCRRDGLTRLREILFGRRATVVLVHKVSRLFRHAYRGYVFIDETVVRAGLRAVSVGETIDTANTTKWQILLAVHCMWREVIRGNRCG